MSSPAASRRALAAFALLVVCATPAALVGCRGRTPRPDIVLVVLDTVRRDRTGAGRDGAASSATPVLDGLAAGSTVFASAWANAPWTVPSHASMFTGLLPSGHGCNERTLRFATPQPALAELLREEGYETAAFFSNPWLARSTAGLTRGFETVVAASVTGPAVWGAGSQGGQEAVDYVGRWLRARHDDRRPFFLFVNLLEAHLPYDPPPAYRTRWLADLPGDAAVTVSWGLQFNAGLHPSAEVDWRRLERLYDGDVATADAFMGQIFDALRTAGRLDPAVVIVTSDHGENLGDHGWVDHQFGVPETLLAVPLVVRAPGRLAPEVRQEPVMLTDIFATVLDAAGVHRRPLPGTSRSLLAAPPANAAARPLVAEYSGAADSLVKVLSSIRPGGDFSRHKTAYATVRVGDLRLTVGSDGSRILNNLAADPRQAVDLAASRPADVERLLALLPALPQAPGASIEPEIPAEERERLRSLGYVD